MVSGGSGQFLTYPLKANILRLFSLKPPNCDGSRNTNLLAVRNKRQTVELDETRGLLYDTDREDLKVKVYSGLYVNEASDLEDDFDNGVEELVRFRSESFGMG